MADPVLRLVDVAVHHRRTRPQPDLVRGGDDLDPHRRRQLALGQHPPHLVVEDLGGGAGDRAQAGFAQADQPVPDRKPALGDAVDDLHRGERVHVHRRHPLLDRPHQIGVAGHRQFRVDAALHAHLGRACDVRLPRPVGDLVDRQRVRVGVALALGERAEPTAGVADVGEVDVPVDDVGDVVADGVAPQRIRQRSNGIQRRAVGRRQAPDTRRRCRPAGSRSAERSAASTSVSMRSGARAASSCTFSRIDSQSPNALPRSLRVSVSRPSVSMAACRSVRPNDSQASSGSCHGRPDGLDVQRQAGLRVGQRVDVAAHPRVDPRRTGLHVLRLRRQPLHQVVAGLGGDRGQLVERRPRPLRVDVIRGQRRHPAPVVDTRAEQRQALLRATPGSAAPGCASWAPSPAG